MYVYLAFWVFPPLTLLNHVGSLALPSLPVKAKLSWCRANTKGHTVAPSITHRESWIHLCTYLKLPLSFSRTVHPWGWGEALMPITQHCIEMRERAFKQPLFPKNIKGMQFVSNSGNEEGSIGLVYCGGLKEGWDQGAVMGTDLLVKTRGVSTSVQNTEHWWGLLMTPHYRGSLCTCKRPSSSKAFGHRARAMRYFSGLTTLPSLKKKTKPKTKPKTTLQIAWSSDTP